MDARWLKLSLSISGAVAILAAATPAFASSVVEGPGHPGHGQEAKSNLSLSVQVKNGDYVFTVSGIQSTNANTELYFRALTASQAGSFSGIYTKPNTTEDDQGSILPASDFTGVGGATISGHKLPHSETFTMPVSLMPSGTAGVTVAQYSIDRTDEHEGEGFVSLPDSIPIGQAPEVPYASVLPLLGLGVGVYLWRSRRQQA